MPGARFVPSVHQFEHERNTFTNKASTSAESHIVIMDAPVNASVCVCVCVFAWYPHPWDRRVQTITIFFEYMDNRFIESFSLFHFRSSLAI